MVVAVTRVTARAIGTTVAVAIVVTVAGVLPIIQIAVGVIVVVVF